MMRNNAGAMINGHKLEMNNFRLKIKAAPTYQEKHVPELYSNSNSGCTHTRKKATQIVRVSVGGCFFLFCFVFGFFLIKRYKTVSSSKNLRDCISIS